MDNTILWGKNNVYSFWVRLNNFLVNRNFTDLNIQIQ